MEELYAYGYANYYNATNRAAATNQLMQAFMMELALYAKKVNPGFKVIPQDKVALSKVNGSGSVVVEELMALIDGWGVEEAGMDADFRALMNGNHMDMASTTTSVTTVANLTSRYTAVDTSPKILWHPRIGGGATAGVPTGTLNWELFGDTGFPRFGTSGDYFWVEDLAKIEALATSRASTINNTDIYSLKDAKNYLYHINGGPYDAWETWDEQTREGSSLMTDRRMITSSTSNGMLVPMTGGRYGPVYDGTNAGRNATVDAAIVEFGGTRGTDDPYAPGSGWDWWWVKAGLADPFNDSPSELNRKGREFWIKSMKESAYDVIYIDPFYNHRAMPENFTPVTRAEVESIRYKPNGGRRQIIAYLNIGAAEQNRWYMQDDWCFENPSATNTFRAVKAGTGTTTWTPHADQIGTNATVPPWLLRGYGSGYPEEAYVVIMHPEWRKIIITGNTKYSRKGHPDDKKSSMDRILEAGFDGVYLDNIDGAADNNYVGWYNYWNANGGIPGWEDD
jgi:endo-alpha-1,4-polygalactosaminidase (GH114 family)